MKENSPMDANTLYFEKISKYDRPGEPVTVSIPFAPGRLDTAGKLIIRDGQTVLPVQVRRLAAWPDGSAKWVLAHFQVDLPGNADKTLEFDTADKPAAVAPSPAVSVIETDAGVEVDTGVLSFRIGREGFLPLRNVRLEGRGVFGETPFDGFRLRVSGREVSTESSLVEFDIEEAGPLRAVILVKGKHRTGDGEERLAFTGRITAYAGKSYVQVEHQFIHTEAEAELNLESLGLHFAPAAAAPGKFAIGEGYYGTQARKSEGPDSPAVEQTINAETVLSQAWEHFIDCFYGDFWADWTGSDAGLTLSIHQAHQNFPKALSAGPDGLTCLLYPDTEPPARILQGMAKTHRIQLYFHAVDQPAKAITARSLQFQLPDRPSLSREWFARNNPWGERFFPERIGGRMMSRLIAMHDSRVKALGMMHFGDAPDAGYTNQGRGGGQVVWVNNEYDRPHACTLFYGLTGLRRVLDSALVSARHWMDVDFCHHSDNPLIHGGLKVHTAYHGTGGVTASHEWVEGLLDYYFLTGRREGLDCAVSVAENMLRHMDQPGMREPGATAVRHGGWVIRAMVAMHQGTGEQRWADEARKLVEMFLDWHKNLGALLAPYTSHSMPRVPFMIALTINSVARYLLIEDDPRIKRLIVAAADDLLEHCLGPDGIVQYKELPSLQRQAPHGHFIETLTHAYRISGDRKYLRAAVRQFAAIADRGAPSGGRGGTAPKRLDPSGAVIEGAGNSRGFASSYACFLLLAAEATPLGLLDWYEYP